LFLLIGAPMGVSGDSGLTLSKRSWQGFCWVAVNKTNVFNSHRTKSGVFLQKVSGPISV
jgi:hypothetical protein